MFLFAAHSPCIIFIKPFPQLSKFNLSVRIRYLLFHLTFVFSIFLFIFVLFKQTTQFLQQINVKKRHVHPVYGAWI